MEELIIIKNARAHNLKGINLELNTKELIVFTGVSGSGKSSMAFDTLYAEGQRRYIQSLSVSARRILEEVQKPPVDEIEGLSPTISIAQKNSSKNPRSTIGTMTEIYDYLRLLYARIGIAHCPISGEIVKTQSKEKIIKKVLAQHQEEKILLFAPFVEEKKGEFKEELFQFVKKGYLRARIDGELYDLTDSFQLDKNKNHTIEILIDRFNLTENNQLRCQEAILSALELGRGMLIVQNHETKKESFYSTHAYSKKSAQYYPPLEPHDFSFNTPLGMCPKCQGLGLFQEFDLKQIIDPKKSIAEDCCSLATSYNTVRHGNIYRHLAKNFHFDLNTPWQNLSEEAQKIFLYGAKQKLFKIHFTHPTREIQWTDYVEWNGVLFEARKRLEEAKSEKLQSQLKQLLITIQCPDCHGSRLRPYPSATLLEKKKIHELCALPLNDLSGFFDNLTLSKEELQIAQELLIEIKQRLNFLTHVGLGYLSLDRTAPTLSGGESQRVHLASQIGSGLVGITYILDEPSIGLHPRDNERLIASLVQLKEAGNTVIVVEHDREMMWAADHLVDFGPFAGIHGGKVVANGTMGNLINHATSLTGAYLSGKLKIKMPKERRPIGPNYLQLTKATHHNLKSVDLKIPLQCLVAITGVSGSGKSSLITETLYPALAKELHKTESEVGSFESLLGHDQIDKVILIDQTPIGRTPRSNPATYLKLFDEIRDLFSQLPESIAKGYSAGQFSFNVSDGCCPTCQGLGQERIDMDFMEDCWIECRKCQGRRFDSSTLSILYKGKSISDVLQMSIEEALDFFASHMGLKRKLQIICEVGLGYLSLGQSATTLSGGEAQRLKLSKELVRPSTGKTLYILDEPTTGLHFYDIERLLQICQRLVDRKNTLIIVEHNMELVRAADWVIDIGPEAGEAGGRICAEARPEKMAKLKTPTGIALKEAFSNKMKKIKKGKKLAKKRESILIEGAKEHNLKSINLELPRDKIICFTGPSGSGKSSLAFDTLYAEGNRRYVESLSPYARQFIKQSPKPLYTRMEGLMATCAIEQKPHSSNPRSTLGTLTECYDYLRLLFTHAGQAYCPESGEKIVSMTATDIFNKFMKEHLGQKSTLLAPLKIQKGDTFENLIRRLRGEGYLRLRINKKIYEIDEPIDFHAKEKHELALLIDTVVIKEENESRLVEAIHKGLNMGGNQLIAMMGKEEILFNLDFASQKSKKSYAKLIPQNFSFNHPSGWCPSCEGIGVIEDKECSTCQGARLNALATHVRVKDKSIVELTEISLEELKLFLDQFTLEPALLAPLQEPLNQLLARVNFLNEVGLGYLTLSRPLATLSNGEAQRVHLARQLGSHLRGILYVLDEPSVGLHPADMQRVNRLCLALKEQGNTLVMVEHDPLTIQMADQLVEFGPKAGKLGGQITFQGTLQECHDSDSLTGQYLSGRKNAILLPPKREEKGSWIVEGGNVHNLKKIKVDIPLEKLTCLTGLSGSGKSTLLHEVILPQAKKSIEEGTLFTKVIVVDQNPIGLSSRSDVGTYAELLAPLRTFFASLTDSEALGLTTGHFSFNHRNGMCSHCLGLGYVKVELLFLPPVKIPCSDCKGLRLNPQSLQVHYGGKNFGQVLQMTIDEAAELFGFLPKPKKLFSILQSVGLGYLQLGQEMATLSGGEAQRIKLSQELAKTRGKGILYLLDEPTTGLHFVDVKILLRLLQDLVGQGNTMILIEHNTDVMQSCDHLIELGPGAGVNGGQIIAYGRVEELIEMNTPTSKYLKI